MKTLCIRAIALAVFVATAFSGSISLAAPAADNFPTSPIKFIVPFAAGGGSDTFCRALAPHFARELGTTMPVENVEGAGTQIGMTALLNAPANGYTIANANQPHLAFTMAVQGAIYKPSDFAWLNIQQIDHSAFSVLPDKPWKNFKDFMDDIKARPGKIAIGATQMAGGHVFLFYLKHEYNLDFIIVPYPGGGEGRAALLGGHIDCYVGNEFSDYSLRGQVRPIAIGAPKRSDLWPDTPTIFESTGDKKLNDISTALASVRGVVVSRKFKDAYPERFNKLVEGYKKAYHSEAHMADCKKIGQIPIMFWTGPEEGDKMSAEADKIIAEFAKYFIKK